MVKAGIDNVQNIDFKSFGRLAVLTTPTGVDSKLIPTYEILNEKYGVSVLFAPEHGIKGDIQAGEKVATYVDDVTGITVYSLYGETKSPTEEMLSQFDTLVFDIQDVGARYYTFIYALTNCMKVCGPSGKKVVVLDRPNPVNGVDIEGIMLDKKFASGVGQFEMPARYGLTVGEFARYINHAEGFGCDLTVVPCVGWRREMYFDETGMPLILPSPNLNTVSSYINYFATCYFEGTNISEGRGTTIPFEIVGAPFINGRKSAEYLNSLSLDGVIFRSGYFTPTFSKHKGERCEGIQLHITDRKAYKPFDAGMYLLDHLRREYKEFEFLGGGSFEAKLFGNDTILRDDFSVEQCLSTAGADCNSFRSKIKDFLIYN